MSTLISQRADEQAAWVALEVDQLAHTSFDLLGAIPATGEYLLTSSAAEVVALIEQDLKGLQTFRRNLDGHLANRELPSHDAAIHRELETIRLLSVQAERNLEATRQEALAAAAQRRPIQPALLAKAAQEPSLAVMRRHSHLLASFHDKLDLQLTVLAQRERHARQLGLGIFLTVLVLAWAVGLRFAWRTADRILRPLLRLEQVMRTSSPHVLPAPGEEEDFSRAPEEIASLNHSFREQLLQVQQLLNRLEAQASTDALTGLANRRRFDEALDQEWRRSLRSGEALSLLLLDVDHFKLYNDHYGHVQGDSCLQQVAATLLAEASRSTDLVCRIGGEEFAVLLPATAEADAVRLAQGIVTALDRLAIPHAKSSVAPHVSLSIGVASGVPSPHQTPTSLIQRADAALYRRKQDLGRHGVCVATAEASGRRLESLA
ncbi:diguanylate cyclase domain-containing protein [Vulcanococcus limneticus]|uniref:GGDEF domain-containing protein n=1 Tax=Vulcanococcus limneticus TaxID=2170428 RepID=UPI00398C0D9D